MPELPPLTILIGPQTKLGLELNAIVRERGASLAASGLTALPSRAATRLLRKSIDSTEPPEVRKAVLRDAFDPEIGPVLLSAVNFLGAPAAAFHKKELFPDAEAVLSGLFPLVGPTPPRIIVTLDAVHRFFLAARSEPLESRVRTTPWEVLYDLSWADLLAEICDALPDSEVLVLTPNAAAVQSCEVLGMLFGAADLPDPLALARIQLPLEGQAALDRLAANGDAGEERIEELVAAFPDTSHEDDLSTRLGLDGLTATLMDKRFREDLDEIEAMGRVRLL